MATVVVEILMEVGEIDMHRGDIGIQECVVGRGVPCKLGRIVTVESFKKGGEGVMA